MPSAQLHAVLDAAVDAVMVIDHAGRILLANSAAERLFGWSAAELHGRDVAALMSGPEYGDAGHGMHDFASGVLPVTGNDMDVQARRRDGSCFPARLSIGQVAGMDPPEFVGFIQDLSDRHREAEAARILNQRLMQVTRMATLGEMAAGIAHEVNQPLAAITNYARAAERFLELAQPDLAEAGEALREITAEAQRAADIIRMLRRITRGSDEEHHEDTQLCELIAGLQALCLADARANDTRIRFELAPDLPPLCVHRLQITQVLLNLVRNALESVAADPPGAREVVVLGRRNAAGGCEIVVRDNGPGVAPRILERMFEPFRSTKPHGTGLGLPMCQTIAQAHGGNLRHEPVSPRGACFVLALPATAAMQ